MGILKKRLPLNRVEGDLELHLVIEDHTVVEAGCAGTMYRGIENLMRGRGPMDSLVITPRICGICTTAHLNAAAQALDIAYGTEVPDNARRLRNITLLVEQLQNDVRHAVMLFMPDLIVPQLSGQPLYDEAVQRYQSLKGETCLQTIAETKKVIEIIAILGGQWPHSSFMVPGGVVSVPTASDITHCRHILRNFRRWYEHRILGCKVEQIARIRSWQDLLEWLVEDQRHHTSDLGFFLRFALDLGLDTLGRGHDTFISYGGPELPESTEVRGYGSGQRLFPSGFFSPEGLMPLDPELIQEDISSSFFRDDEISRHPFDGRTIADDTDTLNRKYSWAKAPRYDDRPAETGPLADMLMAAHPMFLERIKTNGANVLIRELARLIRPVTLLPAIVQWLDEMSGCESPFYRGYTKLVTARGYGLVPAPRGGLGHWVTIENGVIANYQVITPTAWNAAPKDAQGVRGPLEQAIMGTQVEDPQRPIEVEQIVRSFDPCLVCTVHTIRMSDSPGYIR
jgi:hydrogenase large subunit